LLHCCPEFLFHEEQIPIVAWQARRFPCAVAPTSSWLKGLKYTANINWQRLGAGIIEAKLSIAAIRL